MSDRLAVGRERPHSTGVESISHTSSLQPRVSIAKIRITALSWSDAAPQPLVVAGLAGQIGEQVTEMDAGVAQPAGLGHEPGEGLQHRQRDQLGVGQLRSERCLT